MTGNHLMLLLFRSLRSLSYRGSRCGCRVQQSSLIGNSVYIRFYRLSFLVGRIRIYPIPAHNEGVASERSSELDHISILLNPVVYVYQGWSTLRLSALHESRHVYPAMIRLHLKLEVRSVGSRYGAGFIPALWISAEYILPWQENPAANWPCLNKAFLSSLTELCNLCKCLCHRYNKFKS